MLVRNDRLRDMLYSMSHSASLFGILCWMFSQDPSTGGAVVFEMVVRENKSGFAAYQEASRAVSFSDK